MVVSGHSTLQDHPAKSVEVEEADSGRRSDSRRAVNVQEKLGGRGERAHVPVRSLFILTSKS